MSSGWRRPPEATVPSRIHRLVDLLVPPVCVLCSSGVPPGTPPVCAVCWSRLPRLSPPWCPRCGATAPRTELGPTCAECLEWPDSAPPVAAPFAMHGAAARVVRSFKYAGWTALAPAMGRAMSDRAGALAEGRTPALVPVPLSAGRLRERGFNQADLLAREVAGVTGWRVRCLLVRTSGAGGQVRLGRSARRTRVRHAFAARRRPGPGDGRRCRPGTPARGGPPVLLVDDVATTGATLSACREALEAAGWRCVGALAFARTLSHSRRASVGTSLASGE